MILAAVLALAAPAVTLPPQADLTAQVRAADRRLFKLFFDGPCDRAAFRDLLADDVEFYHDKDGFTIRSADDFATAYEGQCKAFADPTAWRSRRELVADSLRVDPVPGWGAMEIGDHLFFERHGDKAAEKLVGKAAFAMVWVLGADGKWRLSRVLSFAHKAIPAKP